MSARESAVRGPDNSECNHEEGKWLYAIWMAYLANDVTNELDTVLKRMSEWMGERYV